MITMTKEEYLKNKDAEDKIMETFFEKPLLDKNLLDDRDLAKHIAEISVELYKLKENSYFMPCEICGKDTKKVGLKYQKSECKECKNKKKEK